MSEKTWNAVSHSRLEKYLGSSLVMSKRCIMIGW